MLEVGWRPFSHRGERQLFVVAAALQQQFNLSSTGRKDARTSSD
jgi:hypothetical protein